MKRFCFMVFISFICAFDTNAQTLPATLLHQTLQTDPSNQLPYEPPSNKFATPPVLKLNNIPRSNLTIWGLPGETWGYSQFGIPCNFNPKYSVKDVAISC